MFENLTLCEVWSMKRVVPKGALSIVQTTLFIDRTTRDFHVISTSTSLDAANCRLYKGVGTTIRAIRVQKRGGLSDVGIYYV